MHGAPRPKLREREVLALAHRDKLGAALPPSYYEIRVIGVLPPEALLDFERLSASVEPVETILHGPLRDQAAPQAPISPAIDACRGSGRTPAHLPTHHS